MILSANQPAYLPWLGYFDKMARSDIFVILDDVQFERNSFINRNRIKVNDKPCWLTIPIKMAGHTGKTIRQMEIDNSTDWRHKHWETIRHNYCHAPFWDENRGIVERSIKLGSKYINYFWMDMIAISNELQGCRPLVFLQSFIGVHGEKQELIIALCRHFGAGKFLFGALGRDYVDVEYFRSQGVEPLFQDFKCPEYPQQGEGFIPNLSIVDSLFCVGIEGVRKLLNL